MFNYFAKIYKLKSRGFIIFLFSYKQLNDTFAHEIKIFITLVQGLCIFSYCFFFLIIWLLKGLFSSMDIIKKKLILRGTHVPICKIYSHFLSNVWATYNGYMVASRLALDSSWLLFCLIETRVLNGYLIWCVWPIFSYFFSLLPPSFHHWPCKK